MKKVIIALVILCLLGGGGAAYYFLVMKKDDVAQSEEQAKPIDQVSEEPKEELKPILDLAALPEQTDFYVSERKIAVFDAPDVDALIKDYLYKGDHIEILEKSNGWGRISDYIVLREGGPEMAEWVEMSKLSEDEVIISPDEHVEILDSYLVKSDDLKTYRKPFRVAIDSLIENGTCEPGDFEELGGWVKSVKYSSRNVYFIYCGGLKLENKIYLDADTGEIFSL
ncbi:hypothetical protein KI655_14015 [Vibrio sp. D404a]|uniref:hypothetical protein n=1 Tax=unclassified Vibrio TaxID=2614977 RepID=UPI002553D954|nr:MULTISPECIES: hypothetical protein [unclassified Vibrio]MDK9738411.1 hypothetical protein [Vibrio sp. D404a]MDK9796225.1 hypothetical protein [Vibrio sp. D449a]